MEHSYSNKRSTNKWIIICVVMVVCLAFIGFILFGIFALSPDKGYYIGDTIKYGNNVYVIVESATEKQYNGDKFNGYTITVNFNIKNNSSEEFKFDLDNIYLQTEDKSEKYERNVYIGDSVIFNESIIPGGKYNYSLSYDVPYSLKEKKYEICFKLKYLHSISHCKLYSKE